jgi:transposase
MQTRPTVKVPLQLYTRKIAGAERMRMVVACAHVEQGLSLLFLPSYSPNLNLIERLWKFMKRRALYGRYHPTFSDFRAAIQEVQNGLSTKYAEGLATLMTLNFQQFEDVSLMAA